MKTHTDSAVERRIDEKLSKEGPLTYKEYSYLFKNKPEIIGLFLQADFVQGLIKKWKQ